MAVEEYGAESMGPSDYEVYEAGKRVAAKLRKLNFKYSGKDAAKGKERLGDEQLREQGRTRHGRPEHLYPARDMRRAMDVEAALAAEADTPEPEPVHWAEQYRETPLDVPEAELVFDPDILDVMTGGNPDSISPLRAGVSAVTMRIVSGQSDAVL